MSYSTRFTFVGKPVIPNSNGKMVFYKNDTIGDKNIPYKAIKFGIKDTGNNIGFVDLMGLKFSTLKVPNEDGKWVDVDWEDRNEKSTINALPFYRLYTVNLGEDYGGRKVFTTQYDCAEFLNETLPSYKGNVMVTGDVEKNVKDNKIYTQYNIRNVFAVDENAKTKLEISADIFYDKDVVDMADFKSEKKVTIEAFTHEYVRTLQSSYFFPFNVVLSAEKYDMSNELHKKRWDYLMGYFKSIPKNKLFHLTWTCRLLNGAQVVEFDESTLTESQKMQLELGLCTLDDFRPAGQIYGESISEIRLVTPILKGDYVDGALKAETTLKEFEDEKYLNAYKKSSENTDIAETITEAKTESSKDDNKLDDLEDLF